MHTRRRPSGAARGLVQAGIFAAAVAILLGSAVPLAGQSRPTIDSAATDITLAEAQFTEHILRDPAAAAELYSRIIDNPRATVDARRTATVHKARCLRLLNRPDAAGSLLTELLTAPDLSAAHRDAAQAESLRLPAVEPSRLMPDDTLVYVEARNPGRTLDDVVDLLARAELADTARLRLIEWLRRAFLTDFGKLLNREVLRELQKIEAVGLGLHNVDFEEVDGRPTLRADALFLLYTGQSDATAGVLRWVVTGLLTPNAAFDGVQFYTPGSVAPNFYVAFTDRLLVICSDVRAGADAVLRYLGKRRGETLYGTSAYQRRPARTRAGNAMLLYANWPLLVDLAVKQAPESRREDFDIIADMLSLRQIGPIFGTLRLDGDRAELELAASVQSEDALLYRLVNAPGLEPAWRDWVPVSALFGMVSGFTPGERRWRDFESLLAELARAQRSATDAEQPATSADPLSGIREFEDGAKLSIAEDLCRSINGIGIVLLESRREPGVFGSAGLVLVLDVDQADAWRRRIEQGLRRWLYGSLSDSPLPTTAVETPVGSVEVLAIPRTRLGIAWQVRGRRVVLAFSVETLVDYLTLVPADGGARPGSANLAPESKFISVRTDALLAYFFKEFRAPPLAGAADAPRSTLRIRTFEQEARFRVLLEQDGLADVLRAVAAADASP